MEIVSSPSLPVTSELPGREPAEPLMDDFSNEEIIMDFTMQEVANPMKKES
jgi:hypothetical protein